MDIVEIKRCRRCNIERPKSDFYLYARNKDGLDSYCKICRKDKWVNYRNEVYEPKRKLAVEKRKQEKQKIRELTKEAKLEARRQKKREYQAQYRQRNPTAYKQWVDSNRGYYNSVKRLRKHGIRNATPKWADLDKINNIYSLAVEMNKMGTERWHVDHEIPLNGKTVCGLHVHENLRIIPAKENLRKSNRLNGRHQ